VISRAWLRASAALAFACSAGPALACAPPPVDTRTRSELDRDVRRQFDAAADLVRVRMNATANETRDGQAVVVRTLKGATRPGSSIRIHTMPLAACGYGPAPRGTTHLLYLNGRAPAFFAPLKPDLLAILTRLRLLPPDWR